MGETTVNIDESLNVQTEIVLTLKAFLKQSTEKIKGKDHMSGRWRLTGNDHFEQPCFERSSAGKPSGSGQRKTKVSDWGLFAGTGSFYGGDDHG